MAGVRTKKEPAFLTRLKKALIETLDANWIRAEVDAEPVPTTRLYRVAVLAPKFRQLKQIWLLRREG